MSGLVIMHTRDTDDRAAEPRGLPWFRRAGIFAAGERAARDDVRVSIDLVDVTAAGGVMGGVAAFAYGLGLIYPPAGWMVLGLAMLAGGARLYR